MVSTILIVLRRLFIGIYLYGYLLSKEMILDALEAMSRQKDDLLSVFVV